MKRNPLVSSVLVLAASLAAGCTAEMEGLDQGSETSAVAFQAGNPNLRIAVVGAGPSGLTAAHTLKNLGYNNVTVLEKDLRVGGKVNSIALGDLRAELGAVFASADYRVVLGLADEFNVPYVTYSTPRYVVDSDRAKLTYQQFLLKHYTPAQIGQAVAAYANVLQTFPEIFEERMNNLPPELNLTFDAFAAAYGIGPVADMAKSLVVGFGYGYYETAPAIYILKILDMLVKVGPTGLESPAYYVFPNGFQSVWEAVAGGLNVRLGATVTKVERSTGSGPIRVTINGIERQDYDAVIVATPLNVAKNFVVLNPHERSLFNKVEGLRYFVTLFTAASLPQGETNFVHLNSIPSRINHVVAWGSRSGSLPMYIGYQIADRSISSTAVTATLAADLYSLAGGIFLAPLFKKEWDNYFPHVDTAALRAGFYDQVEALQGNRGLFYVGGSLAFETVEHSARYAETLVLDNFAAAN